MHTCVGMCVCVMSKPFSLRDTAVPSATLPISHDRLQRPAERAAPPGLLLASLPCFCLTCAATVSITAWLSEGPEPPTARMAAAGLFPCARLCCLPKRNYGRKRPFKPQSSGAEGSLGFLDEGGVNRPLSL